MALSSRSITCALIRRSLNLRSAFRVSLLFFVPNICMFTFTPPSVLYIITPGPGRARFFLPGHPGARHGASADAPWGVPTLGSRYREQCLSFMREPC